MRASIYKEISEKKWCLRKTGKLNHHCLPSEVMLIFESNY